MQISNLSPLSFPSTARQQPKTPETSPGGDVYEGRAYRADQRQQLSRQEIMEYLRSRGMEI